MGRRRRRKESSNTGLIIGLSVGGGLLLLTTVGLVLYFSLSKSGKSDDDSSPGGGLLDLPNARVTEANYQALTDGMTSSEVEAILGVGRKPSKSDFDLVFGERINELSRMPSQQNRETFENNNGRDLVRLWSSGKERLMVTFTQPPDQGGRLVIKLFRRGDGSYGMMQGMGRPPKEPTNATNNPKSPTPPSTQPKSSDPRTPVASLNPDQLLAEFAHDRGAAMTKYRGKPVRITGKIDSVLVSALTFQTMGPRLQAQLSGIATGQIGKYKQGDVITVVGVYKAYFPQTGMVMLENCNLEN